MERSENSDEHQLEWYQDGHYDGVECNDVWYAKAAEEAKKAEAESVLKKLLAEGMSADEILEKLK